MKVFIATSGALVASVLSFAGTVLAAPTIYPRPGNRLAEVNNATKATILADSADPNTLYVMPPPYGAASLANLTYSANVGFCAEMKDLQGYSRNLAKRIFEAVGEIDAYKAEIDALRRKKGQYDVTAEGVQAGSKAVSEAEKLADSITDFEARIDELRDKSEKCAEADSACRKELRDEIETLKKQKTQLASDLRDKRREAGQAMRDFDRLKGQAKSVQGQIDDVYAVLDQKMGFIAKGKKQIFDLYANLARLEGGSASVVFDSGWNADVLAVRAANHGFNVSPIPTSEVRIATSLVPGLGTDSYLASLPVVLDMAIAGQRFNPDNLFQTLPSVPETVTATVRLSLVGACVQRSPADFEIEKNTQGLPVYGLTETYLYPSTFRTNVTARANLWKAYSYMKKVTTEGGFFSSSTKTEVNESTAGDSFVKIVTMDESGLSRDQVNAIEDQIKLDVMQDVLRIMGVPQPSLGKGGVDIAPPPATGATVLAQGVDATCGWLSFGCTGVSWVLRGLGAIFGGSTVEADFRQRYDYSANRSYEREAVSMRSGLIVFKR